MVKKDKHTVPIYRLNFSDSFIEKFKHGVSEILLSDSLSEGEYVKKFEKNFSSIIKSRNCISTTSGTTALEIALRSIGVEGKKVIVPSNTFFATAVSVLNAGGILDLVDCDAKFGAVDPVSLRKKIDNNTAVVILVHVGGIITSNIEKIEKICNEYNVALVEDAAHAHGSCFKDRFAGTIGDVGCFSFFPTKVMTTGEGGMISTNNDDLAKKIRSLKDFGRDPNNSGLCLLSGGTNGKINEFTGLFGYLECERVKNRIDRRNQLVEIYEKELSGTTYEIVTQESGSCSYYKCIVKTQIPGSRIKSFCKERNVSLTGEVYSIPVHEQPRFKNLFRGEKFENTDIWSKYHVCPPLYPELSDEECRYVCETLKEAEKSL